MKKYNFLRKTKKIMNKHVFCRRIGGVKSIYLVYGTKNNGLERLLLPFPKPLFFNRICYSAVFSFFLRFQYMPPARPPLTSRIASSAA